MGYVSHAGFSGEARELYFYAINRPQRCRMLEASLAKIAAFKRAGTLNRDAALRLLRNNARDAAKAYTREFGTAGERWQDWFTVTSRDQCAELFLRYVIEETE